MCNIGIGITNPDFPFYVQGGSKIRYKIILLIWQIKRFVKEKLLVKNKSGSVGL